jgi:hypothetical protein
MHCWFGAAIEAGIADGEFAEADVGPLVDRILALLDGFGIRALIADPAVPLPSARAQVWWMLAGELGLDEKVPPR